MCPRASCIEVLLHRQRRWSNLVGRAPDAVQHAGVTGEAGAQVKRLRSQKDTGRLPTSRMARAMMPMHPGWIGDPRFMSNAESG